MGIRPKGVVMSYETQYAARMRMKGEHAMASPEASERRRLEALATERAEADLYEAYPGGITPDNASEILAYQRKRLDVRRAEVGV